jgi:hypothetical protein
MEQRNSRVHGSTLVRDLDDLDEGARILTRRRAVRIQDCGRLAALWARDGDWRPRILVGCISLQHRKRVHRGAGSGERERRASAGPVA